ncbi:MAG: SAM-dependent methyltransferase, partial [Chloroflexota bacterium]
HYIFEEGNIYDFLDQSLSLLNNGGHMLIGDIPNISKRKRFFSSETGIAFHKDFMKTDKPPIVSYDQVEFTKIDDGVLFGLMLRARTQGFDSYLLPQPDSLPMANRREDLLITYA